VETPRRLCLSCWSSEWRGDIHSGPSIRPANTLPAVHISAKKLKENKLLISPELSLSKQAASPLVLIDHMAQVADASSPSSDPFSAFMSTHVTGCMAAESESSN
jgi:hypothetical protein